MSEWTPAALLARLRTFGAAPALVSVTGDAAEAVSYAALADRIEAVAASLSAAGIRPGDIVALVAPNGPDWVTARLALAAVGAVAAAYDDLIADDELRTLLADGGCRHALASPAHAATIARVAPDIAVIVVGERSWELRLATPPGQGLAPAFTGPALLTYTSGTTGAAKGFFLTYENLRANLDPIVASGLVGRDDRMLLPLPLHHI